MPGNIKKPHFFILPGKIEEAIVLDPHEIQTYLAESRYCFKKSFGLAGFAYVLKLWGSQKYALDLRKFNIPQFYIGLYNTRCAIMGWVQVPNVSVHHITFGIEIESVHF